MSLSLLVFALSSLGAYGYARALSRARRPRVRNYRGEPLPVTLGAAMVGGFALAVAVLLLVYAVTHHRPGELVSTETAAIIGGALIVFVIGFLDDLREGGPRGLRGHVRALLRGRITTGIVKVVAGLGAGAIVAFAVGGSTPRRVVGALVVAGCANLWNLLDVVPGRALKAFLPVSAALILARRGSPLHLVAAGMLGAAAAVLPFDLRERAMLGDSGSNTLGYLVGVGCYVGLPVWGLAVALGVVLVLHLVAETITLSRVIDAVPPLRWLDRLGGRRRIAGAERGGGAREPR